MSSINQVAEEAWRDGLALGREMEQDRAREIWRREHAHRVWNAALAVLMALALQDSIDNAWHNAYSRW